MDTLLNWIREYFEDARQGWAWERETYQLYGYTVAEYDDETGNPKRIVKRDVNPYWLWLIGQVVRDLHRAWVAWGCDHFAFVDESFGGPDSGCMAGRCTRCGWSYHHTLY
jgi:hypothetical protein